jgi:sugar phosphate isomerase/epimerase
MRWSLATIVLVPRGCVQHANPKERRSELAWAAEAGFEGVEISPQWLDIGGLPDAELADFGRQAAAAGLAVSGINVNRCILTRSERAAEHAALLRRAIQTAAILNAPVVTLSLSLPLGGVPRCPLRGREVPLEERARTAELIAQLVEEAAASGICLSLELHDDGLLDTPELCLEMLRASGKSNVGVNPDLGNLVRSSAASISNADTPPADSPGDWRRALNMLAPHTNNWHVKNYRGSQPSPVWDGDIDYGQAIPIMVSAGYYGWVSIESYFGDVRGLQVRSLNWLKQVLANSEGLAENQSRPAATTAF